MFAKIGRSLRLIPFANWKWCSSKRILSYQLYPQPVFRAIVGVRNIGAKDGGMAGSASLVAHGNRRRGRRTRPTRQEGIAAALRYDIVAMG